MLYSFLSKILNMKLTLLFGDFIQMFRYLRLKKKLTYIGLIKYVYISLSISTLK